MRIRGLLPIRLALCLLILSCGKDEKNDCTKFENVWEYGALNSKYGRQACNECETAGFTDIGFIRTDLDPKWSAKDDSLMRLVFLDAGISLQSNLHVFRKVLMENYCTGNLDTAYYLDRVTICNRCVKPPFHFIREFQSLEAYISEQGDTVVHWYKPYACQGW